MVDVIKIPHKKVALEDKKCSICGVKWNKNIFVSKSHLIADRATMISINNIVKKSRNEQYGKIFKDISIYRLISILYIRMETNDMACTTNSK